MSDPSVPRRLVLGHIAETLGIGALGGTLLGLLGMPAGWMSGSIIAVAIASLVGRPMQMPTRLNQAIFVLVGISLGAVVTPATLHGMAAYPLSIAVLLVAMAIVGVVGAKYLQVVHGWDRASAYLAAAPGGLSQVMVLAAEIGADMPAVAIVQTMRVVIVDVGLPAGMSLVGLSSGSSAGYGGAFDPALTAELAILVAASVAAAYFAQRVRFPGGLLFGAMFTSAALHGSGLVHAVLPWWVANTAMVALGAVTGSRFSGVSFRLLVLFIAAALGSFAVAVVIAGVFAAGLISVMSLHLSEVMIAFAPGSVDAMMLLALALHLDPVYVGAHHVCRIFFVSLTMPLAVRRIAARKRDKPAAPPRDVTFQD